MEVSGPWRSSARRPLAASWGLGPLGGPSQPGGGPLVHHMTISDIEAPSDL